MSRRTSRDDLHRRAGQRAASTETRRDASAGRPPVPGDVFLVREAGEHPVHWLILASDPSRPGELLAVLADTVTLVGSRDIEVGDKTVGRLVLRSPFGGWLAADRFDPDLRLGTLPLDRLKQARDHWFGDDKKRTSATREVDEDPEYQHWRRVALEPVYRTFFEEPAEPKRPWWMVAAAAALLLAGAAGFKIASDQRALHEARLAMATSEQKLDAQAQRHQDARDELTTNHRAELVAQRERLIEEYEAKIVAAGDNPVLLASIRRLQERLAATVATTAILNPTLKSLGGGATRGRERIRIDDHASHVVLFIEMADDEHRGSYRLQLHHPNDDEVLWSLDGLIVQVLGEIAVGVPVDAFEKGYAYDLRLVREGEVLEYEIVVE